MNSMDVSICHLHQVSIIPVFAFEWIKWKGNFLLKDDWNVWKVLIVFKVCATGSRFSIWFGHFHFNWQYELTICPFLQGDQSLNIQARLSSNTEITNSLWFLEAWTILALTVNTNQKKSFCFKSIDQWTSRMRLPMETRQPIQTTTATIHRVRTRARTVSGWPVLTWPVLLLFTNIILISNVNGQTRKLRFWGCVQDNWMIIVIRMHDHHYQSRVHNHNLLFFSKLHNRSNSIMCTGHGLRGLSSNVRQCK